MKTIAVTLGLMLAAATAATPALAEAPATTTAPYSIETTPIGVLIDDPRSKAILDAEIPGLTTHANIAAAREMTLRFVQPYAAELVTEAKLAKVEAALKALSAKK